MWDTFRQFGAIHVVNLSHKLSKPHVFVPTTHILPHKFVLLQKFVNACIFHLPSEKVMHLTESTSHWFAKKLLLIVTNLSNFYLVKK